MDTPFESNVDQSFLTTASIEDEQIYLEQPNMLQVEDVVDFSQPIFVEIKPLISMQEDTEDYLDAPTWTAPNEISGTTAILKDVSSLLDPVGVDHLVDRGHGDVPILMMTQDGPSFRSGLNTINPVFLAIPRDESTVNPDKVQFTVEEPERLVHSTIPVPQQDEAAAANIECFDSAETFKQEQVLSEMLLEQDKANAEHDRDLSGTDEDPNVYTHPEQHNKDEAGAANIECFDSVQTSKLEQVLSEMLLEQDKATTETDIDLSGMDEDPNVHTHPEQQNQTLSTPQYTDTRQGDTIHAVSPGEPASVVVQPETRCGHDAVNPLSHVKNEDPLENGVPSQVGADLLDSELEPAAAEDPIEHSNGARTTQTYGHTLVEADPFCSQETAISTPASVNAPAVQDARQVKRRRMIFSAVEVSTLSSATKKRYMKLVTKTDNTIDSELKKSEKMMKHLKNPKVKNDKIPKLSADTVRYRLEQIGLDLFPIALSKSLTDATFQRDMLSHHYGGNLRATFPKIRRDMVVAHGLDDFMYINLQHNPHAPEVPGAPGLWYTVGQARSIARAYPWAKEQRVLSRLVTGIWQYQGQYALIPADSFTKEEWGAQDVKLRNTWAQEIHTRLWGRPTRARISLRARLGRLPTQAELAAALKADSKYSEVTSAQIAEALLKGEETMAVWTMKCVGYDENFQKALLEKQKTWVPSKKTKNGAGKRTKMKKAASKADNDTSKKRKAEALDPEYSPDEDFSDTDDDEIQVLSRMKWLATQRRPRHAR